VEPLRRSNPAFYVAALKLDCFRLRSWSFAGQVASLAMTGETKIKTPPGIGRRFDLSV
jgi:hypothetical protein